YAIARQLPGIHHILTPDNPRQLMSIFDGVELAIGMRLHGLIMAASQKCRCFALSYDPKVTQLMEMLELPGWELTAIPDDANVICKAWLDYYANGLPLDVAQIESLRDRAALHGELFNQVMGNGSLT
ncbi:MAG: polysaccharide pyruvyl transferase CsaB, partial [Kamptonema sp. SIO4C4]|nr:polysaccharide pyruvyl transferase CsaB [Kamptonema sp. SIO4C4]